MSVQRDFILRMIEMMAEMIAGLLGLIKKGELQQAEQSLENAYQDFLKNDAGLFRKIPKEKLTTALLNEHNYTKGHLEVLSELFFAEAELAYAKKDNQYSLEYYEKTKILLDYVIKENKVFSLQKQERLSAIQKRIDELSN